MADIVFDGSPVNLSTQEQFQTFLSVLQPKDGSKELWFKVGHDNLYITNAWKFGEPFRGRKTKLKTKDDPRSRVTHQTAKRDLYKHLLEESKTKKGGVFYIPTQPQEYPLASCVVATDDIGIELDHLTTDEQIALYQEFTKFTGLEFALILTSGGKSIHAHLKGDQHLPLEQAVYLRRIVTIAFNSDPACERLHQPMRAPGFYRKEKGAYQELLWSCDRKYSYQEIIKGLRKWFNYRGWRLPASIPDQWWSEVFFRLYCSTSDLAPEGKAQATATSLEEGPEAYLKRRRVESEQKAVEREQRRQRYKGSTGGDLLEAVNRANDLIGPEAFPGDWIFSGSGHARGPCFNHDSQSGTAAWISNHDGVWKWHCASCTNDQPRDALEFHLALQGKLDISCPKPLTGELWAEEVKNFLIANGFDVPTQSTTTHWESQEMDNQDVTQEELESLEQLAGEDRPQLFDSVLTDKLRTLSGLMNLPLEAYVCSALPVLASQLHSGITLEIDPATDFSVSPIIWMGLVGESGTRKSPVVKAVASPLDRLQEESEADYEKRLEEYELNLNQYNSLKKNEKADQLKPKEPVPKEHYLSDFTLEALAQVVGQQKEDGLLVCIDELAKYFNSMDAYRSKGGDRQHWLSFYDGGPLKTNRKTTGRVYARQTSISILGGIQPSIIQNLMLKDESIHDGLWPRFAWVRIKLAISPGVGNSSPTGLKTLLAGLYRHLSLLPPKTYKLSPEALGRWNLWHSEIEHQIMKEPSGLLRALYPKARERAARIALIVHCTNANLQNPPKEPSETISAETLGNAIQFTRWLIGQTKLLYAEIEASASPEVARILKLKERFANKGWINARIVTRWWPLKEKPKADAARRFMAKVVKLGHAEDNGEPSNSSTYKIKIVLKSSNNSDTTTQKQARKEIELSLGDNDNDGDGSDKSSDRCHNFVPNTPEVSLSVTTLSLEDSDRSIDTNSNSSSDSVTTVITDLDQGEADSNLSPDSWDEFDLYHLKEAS